MGASAGNVGITSASIRPYMTPPITFLAPGYSPRSIRTTLRPARAMVQAAALPAGPAPTTIAWNFSSVGMRSPLAADTNLGTHPQDDAPAGSRSPSLALPQHF